MLVAPEEMMASSLLMRAHGGVNGGANLFPKLYVAPYQAAVACDAAAVAELQGKVMEISRRIYRIGTSGSSYLQGLKAALSILGICNDFLSSPLRNFGVEDKAQISENLDQLVDKDDLLSLYASVKPKIYSLKNDILTLVD